MPQNRNMEAPSDAVRAAPPAHEISTLQVRELLEAIKRSPAGMVQQVGSLLRLFVSVVEAKLPSASAPPAAAKEGRAAATAGRSNPTVTTKERESAENIVVRARARQARGSSLADEGKKEKVLVKGEPKDKMKTLRSWAARCNRRVPRLMGLLETTPKIGADDALLVQHHAELIAPREAGKALSAAAAALAYVTRVSSDTLFKARGKVPVTSGFGAGCWEAYVVQRSHHQGLCAEHRPREDGILVHVSAEEARTAAVRVQALVRGFIGRRAYRADNAVATLVRTCGRARGVRHEAARRVTGAATVEAQTAAAAVVQAFWRGVRSRDALFCRTIAAIVVQRWRRSTIVLRHLARARLCAQQHGAQGTYSATVCVEFCFRTICKSSVSMSAYSRVYRTAAMLLQQRWMKTVENAFFETRCGEFDKAEAFLRSLIRRHPEQPELDGVVKSFKASQFAADSISGKTTRFKAADEAWLVEAEALLSAERSRAWRKVDRQKIRDSCANDINCVAGQRSTAYGVKGLRRTLVIKELRLRRLDNSTVEVSNPHGTTVGSKVTSHSSGLVEGAPEAEEKSVQGKRPSTDLGATDEKGVAPSSTESKAPMSRSLASKPAANSSSKNILQRSKGGRRPGDINGRGSHQLDSSPIDQQVALSAHKSNTSLTAKAPLSAASARRNAAKGGDQLPAIQSAITTTPRRNKQRGLCTPHERPPTARESAAEQPNAAIGIAPPTRQLPSSSQLRVLLNALMHTPVGAVQQVGFLLVLFVSVVEASLPTIDAPAAASITGRPALTAADGSIVVTKEGSERATKIVAAAKARLARGNRLAGAGGKARPKDAPNVKMENLRRWAARRNQKVQRLLRLLQQTKAIGVDDALLIRHHAEGIVPREAGKALSAAGVALSYIERVSGDAIAQARADTGVTEGVTEDTDESLAVDAAMAGMRTAVIRIQALARGVLARRACRAEKRFERAHMGSTSPVATCLEMADEASLVAAKSLSKTEQSLTCGRRDQQISGGCFSSDSNCAAGKRSSSMDSDSAPDSNSSKEPGSLSGKDSTSTPLGGALLEPDSTLSARAKSEDLSETGVSNEEGSKPLDISPTDTSEALFTQHANNASAMDLTMTLKVGRNRVVKTGGPLPTLQQATVTFDEAFVWPVASSGKADEATVAGAEELPYGGGQIIGHHGEVISSETHRVTPFFLPHTPTPRREGPSKITSPPETPTSPPQQLCPSTPPSTPSPRRRRRREGGRTSPGRLRSRSPSLSLIRVSTATCRPQKPFSTPPFSPGRFRTKDPVATPCHIAPALDTVAEADDSSQAGRTVPVADSAKLVEGSSQAEEGTPASDLLVSCLPAASGCSSSRDASSRPRMRWGLEGTYQPRRRPALSRTGGPARLPVAQFRSTLCVQSKLQQEQFVAESETDSDDESDAPPSIGTAVHLHGKSVNGWRQDGDELLETGIFPPARFLQFRTCPRYWCYQDYVPSDQEMKMCARIPAVLVGGGARVLIADVVEEHGRPAIEIAIERSVRNAFNGGSRCTQRFCTSSEELKAERDSLARATAAGAGHDRTIEVESTPSADGGARGAGASSDTRALDGDSVLAAQFRTSLKEQERALEQCQARYCSNPSSSPGTRGAGGILAADSGPCGPSKSSETNTEVGDSGLAALYGTSLREQEEVLALCNL